MEKLVITVTCDSTMSYPRNPYNPGSVPALADEYVRGVNAGMPLLRTMRRASPHWFRH